MLLDGSPDVVGDVLKRKKERSTSHMGLWSVLFFVDLSR